jgi:hypothetical protein
LKTATDCIDGAEELAKRRAAFILSEPDLPEACNLPCLRPRSSTALTVLVIPALYVRLRDDGQPLEMDRLPPLDEGQRSS